MARLKPLVVYGAGGSGREIAWLIQEINQSDSEWDFLGFIDDHAVGQTVEGYRILGGKETLEEMSPRPNVVCSLGNPSVRARIVSSLEARGYEFATLVHPSVRRSDHVQIGCGSVVCADAVLTTNVSLGRHVLINLGSRVGHDSVLGDFASLMYAVNIAGEVTVGTGCYFGSASCVINRVSIGDWTTIGAGAVVIEDIPGGVLAVGLPARVKKVMDVCGNEREEQSV